MICVTYGWIEDASQTLEYGKNYEGYWTGELFVKQVIQFRFLAFKLLLICTSAAPRKVIPAFEALHGPGYQAFFLIDNSQGHSAYAVDALLALRMNV